MRNEPKIPYCEDRTCKHYRKRPTKIRRFIYHAFRMAYPVGGSINVGWPHDPRWK